MTTPDTTLAELAQMMRDETGGDFYQLLRPAANAMLTVAEAAAGDFAAMGEDGGPVPRRLHVAQVIEAFEAAVVEARHLSGVFHFDPGLSN